VLGSAIYALLYALTNIETGPTACRVEMFFVMAAFDFINWLQLCISLNLIFALYCPNVFRYRIHLVFYASSFVVGFGLSASALAADVYRWTPATNSCWITSKAAERGEFDYWQLALIEVPLLLGTIVMTASLVMVAYRFFWDKKNKNRAPEMLNQLYEPTVAADSIDFPSGEGTTASNFQITEVTVTPAMHLSPLLANPGTRLGSSIYSGLSTNSSGRVMKAPKLDNIVEEGRKILVARLPISPNMGKNPVKESSREMRKTIWRISIYPLLHLILATSGAVGQLMLQASEGSSQAYQMRLFTLISQFSAWVPLAYILPALFADTSLIDGLQEWIRLRRDTGEADLELALGKNAHLEIECDVVTITQGKAQTQKVLLDDWSQDLPISSRKSRT
jgi:hypothetical protein